MDLATFWVYVALVGYLLWSRRHVWTDGDG